jgi:RNA polymerase sigma-70 factor (ECF subfamily)
MAQCPRPEYPRPQFVRADWLNLNGQWQFEIDAGDSGLERGLKDLPEKFSEVIVMKVWGERTFAEIGETLGISQNTAASRYRYGLEALKRHLSNARQRGDLSI